MIYLFGSTGKVGKSISRLLAQNFHDSFSPLIRSKSYRFKQSDEETILILCVYSRLLIPLLLSISALTYNLLTSGTRRILIINITSYAVLASPIYIGKNYPSLAPYFFVRSLQDLFLRVLSRCIPRVTLSTIYLSRLRNLTCDHTHSSADSLENCISLIASTFIHDNDVHREILLYPDFVARHDLSQEDKLFSQILKHNLSKFAMHKHVFRPST